jgi:hypothetical protein
MLPMYGRALHATASDQLKGYTMERVLSSFPSTASYPLVKKLIAVRLREIHQGPR